MTTSNDACTVLLVEDEADQRQLVASIMEQAGFTVIATDSVEAAILALKEHTVDVIFSDWKLGNLTGIDLLNHVSRYHRPNRPELGFIIATAYGSINHAVEAIQAGADDYLAKPFQRQALLLTLEKVRKAALLKRQNKHLSAQLSEQRQLVNLIGQSPGMQRVYDRIQRVAQTDVTVLINGESGTGKELAARALHQLSPRADKPFIAINCGAIPESLAEAELFGAEKGAFTGANGLKIGKFEAADGGTVFLDEIGELPLTLQTRLLRLLQENCVTRLGAHTEIPLDIRVIAATHRNLPEQVETSEFREDLFYRLNVVPLTMPALRERSEDIPALVQHFLASYGKRHQCMADNGEPPTLSRSQLKTLMDYHWPGNVRELANTIERFVLLGDDESLTASLRAAPASREADPLSFTLPADGVNWEQFERHCLADALSQCDGNKTKAARFLQLPYKAFLYRLEKYGLKG